MGFKEDLIDDLDNIFFNIDEFSEHVEINDKEMKVVIDEDGLEEYKSLQDVDSDGIYVAKMLIYIKADDIGYKPVVDGELKVKKRKYIVISISEDFGVYRIVLGVNRS